MSRPHWKCASHRGRRHSRQDTRLFLLRGNALRPGQTLTPPPHLVGRWRVTLIATSTSCHDAYCARQTGKLPGNVRGASQTRGFSPKPRRGAHNLGLNVLDDSACGLREIFGLLSCSQRVSTSNFFARWLDFSDCLKRSSAPSHRRGPTSFLCSFFCFLLARSTSGASVPA